MEAVGKRGEKARDSLAIGAREEIKDGDRVGVGMRRVRLCLLGRYYSVQRGRGDDGVRLSRFGKMASLLGRGAGMGTWLVWRNVTCRLCLGFDFFEHGSREGGRCLFDTIFSTDDECTGEAAVAVYERLTSSE